MRRRPPSASAVSAAALAVLAGCGPPPARPSPDAALTAEVAAFLEDYLSAVDGRDTDRIRSALVGDGRFVWIEDGEVRYRGPAELVAGIEAFPLDTPIRTELVDLAVVPVGATAAHAWGTFTTAVGTGPGSFSFGGAISVLVERIDGLWMLIGGHTSSPRHP
jgi:hypothetical protein